MRKCLEEKMALMELGSVSAQICWLLLKTNLAVFGPVSIILFKTSLLGEVLALLSGLAGLLGDFRVCSSSVQVKL